MPGELAPAAIFGFVILKLDYSSRTYLYRFSLISNVFFESLYPVSLNIEKCTFKSRNPDPYQDPAPAPAPSIV